LKLLAIIFLIFSLKSFAQVNNEYAIDLVDEAELEKIISERSGKFLLINIWATWCIPCREEFPDLVLLKNNYKNKLDVIAISVDFKDEVNKKVIPFLSQTKVNFPVYLSDFSKDEELIKFFSSDWNGALPGTFIYDKAGKQIFQMEGKQSYESFSSYIKKL